MDQNVTKILTEQLDALSAQRVQIDAKINALTLLLNNNNNDDFNDIVIDDDFIFANETITDETTSLSDNDLWLGLLITGIVIMVGFICFMGFKIFRGY